MPLPNPRLLPPEMRFATTDFKIVTSVELSRTNGGSLLAVEHGDPFWVCSFTSPPHVNEIRLNKIRAWWDSLQGGICSFLAHDQARKFPEMYQAGFAGMNRAGGGAFDGTGDVTAIAPRALTIATLPAGFALKRGDYVGLVQAGRYSLHRIVDDVTATGLGVAADIPVEPFITSLFTPAAVANFAMPLVELVPDAGSWSGSPTATKTTVSFAGVSRIRG